MFPLEKRKNKTIIINIITIYSFNYPNSNEVSMPLYLLFEKEGNYLKQDTYHRRLKGLEPPPQYLERGAQPPPKFLLLAT